MEKNGASLVIVKQETGVATVIHALSNSSTPRYTNPPNVMTYSKRVIVLEDYFALLHTLNPKT